jgi:hypothetical protein
MKFTAQKPTKLGYYFVIAKYVGLPYTGVCEVYSKKQLTPPDLVWFEGENYPLNSEIFIAFAGPITEPEQYKADRS